MFAHLESFNRDHPKLGHLLAINAGLLLPLGFAPFALRLLPFIALLALLCLLLGLTPKMAFWRGFVFGLGMYGFGVSWVYNSLHDFGNAHPLLAAAINAALVLALAAFIGGLGYALSRWFRSGYAFQCLMAFPSLWLLQEWLHSWVLTGFPWLLLGYSQVDTFLSAYLPVIGVLGLGGIMALFAGSILLLLLGNKIYKMLAASLMASSILFAGCLQGVEWTQPSGKPLKVALVQGNIPQDIKLNPEFLTLSLQRYRELSRAHYDSDLIVWPETAIPAFRHQVRGFLQPLAQEYTDHNTTLLTGIFVYEFASRRYYNSFYKLGDEEVLYHKQHLVPFGEYMPLRPLLRFLDTYIQIPMSDIAAGHAAGLIPVRDTMAGMSICYESAYAKVFRRQLPAAGLFVNASNDAWFGDSLAPHQHLEIARSRARETERYLLRATNTGISAVIDPQGQITQRAPQFEAAVVRGTVQPREGLTPYARYGDSPALLWVCCLLLIGIWPRVRILLSSGKSR